MRRDSLFVVACACLPVWACDEDVKCGYFGDWKVAVADTEPIAPESWDLEISGSSGNENVLLAADGVGCVQTTHSLDSRTCAMTATAECMPLETEFDAGTPGSGDLWTVELTFTHESGEWSGSGRWIVLVAQQDDVLGTGPATATK